MSNIVDARARFRLLKRLKYTGGMSADRFLLDEGLDLLASYRSIQDEEARRVARDAVAEIARSSNLADPPS